MGFLSEVITSVDQTAFSPFTESIILATICGRALSHRQQSVVEHVYSNVPQHFWDRHEWLDTILKTRTKILRMNYPPPSQHADCMLLFTSMVAQMTVLYLCKVMVSMSWETDEYRSAIAEFKHRSLQAAQEIVNLTRSLSHLSYFKVSARYYLSDKIGFLTCKHRPILLRHSRLFCVRISLMKTATSMTRSRCKFRRS